MVRLPESRDSHGSISVDNCFTMTATLVNSYEGVDDPDWDYHGAVAFDVIPDFSHPNSGILGCHVVFFPAAIAQQLQIGETYILLSALIENSPYGDKHYLCLDVPSLHTNSKLAARDSKPNAEPV